MQEPQETAVRSLGREDPLEEGLDLRSRELQAEGIESAKALGQECQSYFRMRKEEELGEKETVGDVRGQSPSALWAKAQAFVLSEKGAFRGL